MKIIIKLAWRNLWRNKRRTAITMASVFFAVILATLMMSVKHGMYKSMLDGMVSSYTGYAQIHAAGYWESKHIDDAFMLNDSLKQALDDHPEISGSVQRIEGFALSASDSSTKGAMVVGTDPEGERAMTQLDQRVVAGEFFTPSDKAVLIGQGLADYHGISVGDTIVLLGQGYHGTNAAGKYPIKGIIKFGSPDLSKQLVMLPIEEAKRFFGTEGHITNLVLLFQDPERAEEVVATLKNELGDAYEVMAWPELVPQLVDMIEADKVEGYIFMFILYMVISFGIFGTVLMMLAERKHEFGVLVAIGMKRTKLGIVVFIETLTIAILGAMLGMLGAFPVCAVLHYNPIRFTADDETAKLFEEYGMEAVIQASIDLSVFLQQAGVVAVVASLIAVYPLLSIIRINANKAMHS